MFDRQTRNNTETEVFNSNPIDLFHNKIVNLLILQKYVAIVYLFFK